MNICMECGVNLIDEEWKDYELCSDCAIAMEAAEDIPLHALNFHERRPIDWDTIREQGIDYGSEDAGDIECGDEDGGRDSEEFF